MLQDIAILTGGQVICEELGLELKDTTMDQLGRARQVKVQKENTIIVDGAGNSGRDQGAESIRSKLRLRPLPPSLTARSCRSAWQNCAGGVAVIKVGAATESGDEREEAAH